MIMKTETILWVIFNKVYSHMKEKKKTHRHKGCPFRSLTSLGCLKLLGYTPGALSFSIIDPYIEQVQTEGVEARQHALGMIPTKYKNVLLHVIRIVLVVVFSPVRHLKACRFK